MGNIKLNVKVIVLRNLVVDKCGNGQSYPFLINLKENQMIILIIKFFNLDITTGDDSIPDDPLPVIQMMICAHTASRGLRNGAVVHCRQFPFKIKQNIFWVFQNFSLIGILRD
ncbi:MAG: hypothetical protein EZS28_024697 [Streblomastix strix]|uniref:Uncharacterized protein n=1 Tax=Streblomastix strix TaxID=222440 RepID=A0A5J4VBF9_9EUKA|nr:MAG: hypothetical protein EZS28_024697 [Streblomastix strix]